MRRFCGFFYFPSEFQNYAVSMFTEKQLYKTILFKWSSKGLIYYFV